MAKIANVVDRYDTNPGVREDLTDIITNVDPEETPVFSSLGRASSKQTYHEYQRDTLRAPNGNNAAVDGDQATPSAKTMPNRIGNYTQIFQDTWGVTGRTEAVNKAGRKSEMARLGAKVTKELKRDIEARVISKSVAAPGSTGVASAMAGLGVHLYTNALHNGAGATAAHTSGAPTTAVTAGTNRALTDTLVLNAAQACFIAAGKAPPMMVMSPAHKRRFGAFTGISASRTETKKKPVTIIAATDAILTDFGEIQLVPHYMMDGANYLLGLDPEFIKAAYLRGWKTHDLGRRGDSEEKQMLVDLTIEVLAEKNMFKIDDLIPAGV